MLPIFQLVDVTVHPSLVCFQGSRLEQGRTPGLKRQGGQAEGLQQRLTSLPAAFTSRAPTTLLISHPGRAIHLKPQGKLAILSEPSTATCSTHRAQACVVNMASPLRGIGRHQSHFRENTSPGAIYNTHNLTGVAAPLHI